MKDTSILNQFPRKQVKPYDGMSVTADVWLEAHAEHRQSMSAHVTSLHGAGIIMGLEVIANDPADKFVFISPGAAIDPAGNIIIVPETVAYDFGETSEGTLYMMLGYGEREIGGVEAEIRYIQSEFVIAARPSLPKRPAVELARVSISRAKKSIQNAVDSLHPGQNELDLRFRGRVEMQAGQFVSVAVCHLGRQNRAVTRGWDLLGKYCQHDSRYRLIVDAGVPFGQTLAEYDLVYVACAGAAKVDPSTLAALKGCVDAGIPLFIEALDEAADSICQELLVNLDLKVQPLTGEHPLMSSFHYFIQPPEGNHGHDVKISSGAVYSTAAYSLAWSGLVGSKPATRSEIRDAHEWGSNLIHYFAHDGKTR